MAVSDRKTSGFQDSLSKGCDEFTISCDPCTSVGQYVEAKGFCINCQENLCKVCFDAHKKARATKKHNMLNEAQEMSSKTAHTTDESKMPSEFCKVHQNEVLKFFCSKHNEVGCKDCMTLQHRTCKIDYIPDKCDGVLESKEFSKTMKTVADAIKAAEVLLKKTQSLKTENKANVDDVLKESERLQKLNDQLEKLEQNLVKEANSHQARRDTDVDATSDSCVKISTELKQLLTILQDCQDKKLDGQAFVTMKHAQSVLNSSNVQKYKHQLSGNRTEIFFKANKEIENILSQPSGLGKLSIPDDSVTKQDKLQSRESRVPEVKVRKEKATVSETNVTIETRQDVSSYVYKNHINVRTKSDNKVCHIAGCAVISAHKLLLTDFGNNKLKVVNIDTLSVVEEMTVDGKPWDVTVLPQDQAAVTLPDKGEILILDTAGKLKTISSIKVSRLCWGITYHQDHLYAVCNLPKYDVFRGSNSLLVLDMRGNVQREIPLGTAQTFSKPRYVAVSKNGERLYISDYGSNFVASLTLQGEITAVYTHPQLAGPHGLLVLGESLLVCCWGTIHYLQADIKQGGTLSINVPGARSICYNPGNQQIYVGSERSDQIKVFTLQ